MAIMTSFLDDHVTKAIARVGTRPLFFHEQAAVEAAEKAGKWDATKHPRDGHGRFIEIGGIVDMPDGGEGRVVGLGNDNKIQVELANGKKKSIDAKDVNQVEGPNEGGAERELREAPDPKEEKKRIKETREQLKARSKEIKDSRKDDREPNQFTDPDEWDAWEAREAEANAARREISAQLRQLTADEKALSGKKDDEEEGPGDIGGGADELAASPNAGLPNEDLGPGVAPEGVDLVQEDTLPPAPSAWEPGDRAVWTDPDGQKLEVVIDSNNPDGTVHIVHEDSGTEADVSQTELEGGTMDDVGGIDMDAAATLPGGVQAVQEADTHRQDGGSPAEILAWLQQNWEMSPEEAQQVVDFIFANKSEDDAAPVDPVLATVDFLRSL